MLQFIFKKYAKFPEPKQTLAGVLALTGLKTRTLTSLTIYRELLCGDSQQTPKIRQKSPEHHDGSDLAVMAPLDKPVLRL